MFKSKKVCRSFILAGFAVLASSASAFSLDPDIMIDRALNSPTLTVRYTGVNAVLVELRVNGESIATRSVTSLKAAGETNFTLSIADLKDGDNEVEIRLYDRTGKLVGKDKTNISSEQSNKGPIFLQAPKIGASLQGPVEIKVGFTQELRNSYVSFFVDGNFKSMTNFPPYTFTWDSERESNGWHEIEAWAIDDSSTTHKTKKVRVFVNNPGGRTKRVGAISSPATPRSNALQNTDLVGSEAGLKSFRVIPGANAVKNSVGATVPSNTEVGLVAKSTVVAPAKNDVASLTNTTRRTTISKVENRDPLSPKANKLSASITAMTGIKAPGKDETATSRSIVTGQKSLTPTGTRLAMSPIQTGAIQAVRGVTTATTLLPIMRGTRLPELKRFDIVLDSQFVNFDVLPRVDGGVPMTPFRHLIEKAGGKVEWTHLTKSILATSDGHSIQFRIGDRSAKVDSKKFSLELAPYLDRGRTIIPLSFLRDALQVQVDYDKETGHVLITSNKK